MFGKKQKDFYIVKNDILLISPLKRRCLRLFPLSFRGYTDVKVFCSKNLEYSEQHPFDANTVYVN